MHARKSHTFIFWSRLPSSPVTHFCASCLINISLPPCHFFVTFCQHFVSLGPGPRQLQRYLVIPGGHAVEAGVRLQHRHQLREVGEEVWRHVEVLLQHDGVARRGEQLEGGAQAGLVMLRDARVADPDGRVLHAAQPEQLGHGARLVVEPVDEDGDHVGVGAVSGEQRAQHPAGDQ